MIITTNKLVNYIYCRYFVDYSTNGCSPTVRGRCGVFGGDVGAGSSDRKLLGLCTAGTRRAELKGPSVEMTLSV